MMVITTLKSNRVGGRKESWALVPAVLLTSGVAREASLTPRSAFAHWSRGNTNPDCSGLLGDLQ